MKLLKKILLIAVVLSVERTVGQSIYSEPYRPQIHFSPKAHWINDPNGMVYDHGIYHLFFQYYPGGTTWGPMHWGHAVSKDLIHWEELHVSLYPDKLGYIFSGSAVVDSNNTSALGKKGQSPLVAIFTHHDPVGEKEGKDNFQNQSIAYSIDQGVSWTKYPGNPVLKNPGIKDFRDPKVMWYEPQKRWVMTLATKDHITFYSATDLKTWNKESEFGLGIGAHGGVWECPDLFPLKLQGKTYWILIVNLNPGGPNGGSGTQYFVGNFNGNQFVPLDNKIRWIDYGPDEYAGITWSNTGDRKVFLGWMSNWNYANQLPTEKWRNAMTLPRELHLEQNESGVFVASLPIKEVNKIAENKTTLTDITVNRQINLTKYTDLLKSRYILSLNLQKAKSFTIKLSNDAKDELTVGFDTVKNEYFIDRNKSGNTGFQKNFAGRFTSPRLNGAKNIQLILIVDKTSVEFFADRGSNVMTTLFFPHTDLNKLFIESDEKILIKNLEITGLKSIWN